MLGPQAGLTLIDSTPGMGGIIACRKPDGHVGLAMSQRLSTAFHPVSHRS